MAESITITDNRTGESIEVPIFNGGVDAGEWAKFLEMLPMYNEKCWGEGGMHDTAMLLGALGAERYDRGIEVITPYFGSSGTGQINAVFPVS